MKFCVKRFSGIAFITMMVVFAHAGKLLAQPTTFKQAPSGKAVLSSWSLHHGEIERDDYAGGQVQMASHRQSRPTHSARYILNVFSPLFRTRMCLLALSTVFVVAGFTSLSRLLLFPHHSFH